MRYVLIRTQEFLLLGVRQRQEILKKAGVSQAYLHIVTGVEKRIRTEKAPHLHDTDGDSCHHMKDPMEKQGGSVIQDLEVFGSN